MNEMSEFNEWNYIVYMVPKTWSESDNKRSCLYTYAI